MVPKITIITTVYNRCNTIEQTISSVVNQTYPNLEYVIIDGGSTDGTVDIIKKYEQKISYWISEKDNGIYDACNKGVHAATGSYIQFLGADDCLCSYDIIERIAKEIDEDTDILSCPVYIVDEQHCVEVLYDNHSHPHTQGVFARRELYIKYPLDTQYRIASDYKFFLLCYNDDTVKFKYIDIPVAFFSLGGASSVQADLTNQELIEIANQFGVKYPPEEINENSRKKWIKFFKISLKKILIYFHIFPWIQKYVLPGIQRFIYWKKHHCSNKICRWCKRDMECNQIPI